LAPSVHTNTYPVTFQLDILPLRHPVISPYKVIQGHRFWYQLKAHIRLLIKMIARQYCTFKSWIYEAARNLYRRCHVVPLQTFTTRHSNSKLSIVMALSTTFTQYALKITEFGKNNAK